MRCPSQYQACSTCPGTNSWIMMSAGARRQSGGIEPGANGPRTTPLTPGRTRLITTLVVASDGRTYTVGVRTWLCAQKAMKALLSALTSQDFLGTPLQPAKSLDCGNAS